MNELSDRGTGDGADAIAQASRPARILGIRVPFFYGWVIVVAVFIAEFMAAGVGSFMVPLFFKPMSVEMGWSLTMLTGVLTAQTIVNAGVAPVLGRLLDKIGAKPVMIWGAVVAGLGLMGLTRIQEIWQLWLLYGIVGALGLSEMGGFTGPVLISKWFIKKRGRALSLATLGTTAGGAVMAPIIGLLIVKLGWRDTLGLLGIVLMVIMLPTALLLIRRQPEDMGLVPDGAPAAPKGIGLATGSLGGRAKPEVEECWTVKEAMRSRTLWVLVISLNLVTLAGNVLVFHLVPFLTLQGGMSAQGAGMVLTARLVIATFSRVMWGAAADRFPIRLCLAAAFFSRALMPGVLVLLPYPYNVVGLLVTNVAGGGFAVLQPMAFANFYGRRHSGAIQGTVRPFLTISSLAGPLIISLMFDLTGTFTLIFLISSALGMVASGIALFAKPPRKPVAIEAEPPPKAIG